MSLFPVDSVTPPTTGLRVLKQYPLPLYYFYRHMAFIAICSNMVDFWVNGPGRSPLLFMKEACPKMGDFREECRTGSSLKERAILPQVRSLPFRSGLWGRPDYASERWWLDTQNQGESWKWLNWSSTRLFTYYCLFFYNYPLASIKQHVSILEQG